MRLKVKGSVSIALSEEDVCILYNFIGEAQRSSKPDQAQDECFEKIAKFFCLEIDDDNIRPERDGTDAAARNKG